VEDLDRVVAITILAALVALDFTLTADLFLLVVGEAVLLFWVMEAAEEVARADLLEYLAVVVAMAGVQTSGMVGQDFLLLWLKIIRQVMSL
jgi:hypothetical protein